jgi:hypothetical protein
MVLISLAESLAGRPPFRREHAPLLGRQRCVPGSDCVRIRRAWQRHERPVPLGQKSLPQHAPYAGRTHRHDVCVEHHERQPAVALQRVLQMKADDGPLLPILQPEAAGNPAVVLVHLPVAFPPVVELAGGDVEPPMNRPAPISVFSDQRRRKSTCGTQLPVRVPQCLSLARRSPPSTRPEPRPSSGCSFAGMQSVPGQRNGRLAVARVPLHRTTSRWAPSPGSAASEWRPSLPARIASVASSCVLSISSMGERLLHFQLNRNNRRAGPTAGRFCSTGFSPTSSFMNPEEFPSDSGRAPWKAERSAYSKATLRQAVRLGGRVENRSVYLHLADG